MAGPLDISFAGGKNDGVVLMFNRPSVFSAQECNAVTSWAEAKRIADMAKIDCQLASLGSRAFTRKHKKLTASPAPRDRAVAGFQRKLRGCVEALNRQIWRFHVTRFSELFVIRYEAGDEVGLHMDIDMEHCDAKLSALVQLSAADSYEGGVLGFGLPLLPAYREQGSLLVFPAWMPHQVTPTRSGIRYSLLYSALGPSFR